MTKYRLTTNGELYNYQEQLPSGEWWTASYPRTKEQIMATIENEMKNMKDSDTYKPTGEEFDSK